MFYLQTLTLNMKPEDLDHKDVLGIEVTMPEFAEKCNLGNIDHHGKDSTLEMPAACEQSLSFPIDKLSCGSTLFTTKPDIDSVTAMAVICSRFIGRKIDATLVRKVGLLDRFGSRSKVKDYRLLAMAKRCSDITIPLEERVRWVQNIFEHKIGKEEITRIIKQRLQDYKEAKEESDENIKVFGEENNIALVISTKRWGMGRGYKKAPITVAYNPEHPLPDNSGVISHYTIGQRYGYNRLKIRNLLTEIEEYEDGWNGRENIIGSSQYKSSGLSPMEVISIVENHIKGYK